MHTSLLVHLDALYAFAQLLAPDPAAAAELVRGTYARAFAHADLPDGSPETVRTWLFGLMFEEQQAELAGALPSAFLPDTPAPPPEGALDATRQRYAESLVTRLLPSALVALDEQSRLLLALVEVSAFTPASGGALLGLAPDDARRVYDRAHAEIARSLRFAAAPHEQPLLDRVMDSATFDEMLETALEADLEPTPPTLRAMIPVPEPPSGAVVTEGRTRSWSTVLWALLLIVGAGLTGYLATRSATPEARPTDLIAAAADDAPRADVLLRTDDVAVAERFALDHVGWRVAVPQIDGMPLAGVGVREVVPGVAVPVFVYQNRTERATLYGFDYHLLDQTNTRLRLDRDVFDQIEDDRHYEVHDLGSASAILWRDRDDILVLVTRGDANDLRLRIGRTLAPGDLPGIQG